MYAGFWRRLCAFAIDYFILFFPAVIISAILASTGYFSSKYTIYVVVLFIRSFYWIIMESSPLQATVGKRVLNLTVVDTQGNRLSFLRATARVWLKVFSFFTLFLGFLMASFTPRKQTLHDVVSGSLVLYHGGTMLAANPVKDKWSITGLVCSLLIFGLLLWWLVIVWPVLSVRFNPKNLFFPQPAVQAQQVTPSAPQPVAVPQQDAASTTANGFVPLTIHQQ